MTTYSLPETESTNLLLLYWMCHAHYHIPVTQKDLCHIVHCHFGPPLQYTFNSDGFPQTGVYRTDESIVSRISRLYPLLTTIGSISQSEMESDIKRIVLEHLKGGFAPLQPLSERGVMGGRSPPPRPETLDKEWIKLEEFKRLFDTNKICPKVFKYLCQQSTEDHLTWMIEYLKEHRLKNQLP